MVNWLRVARMGGAWARGTTLLSYAPKNVSIEPTNLCNYRCSFCPQSDPVHQTLPSGYMKLEHLEDILEKVRRAGAAWHGVISFTHDGEPLLHPEFPEFVRLAGIRGFRSKFSSNGSKLTPTKLDALVETGHPFQVCIDFSGSKEIFERYRSKRSDWNKVRDNIAYAIDRSNTNSRVQVLVTEIGGFVDPGNVEHHLERMKAALPRPASRRVQFHVRNFHNASGLVQLEYPKGKVYRQCPYPWFSLNVAWNGDVHACPRDRGQTKLGNLLEAERLEDVWNGEAYQRFRELHAARRTDQISSCAGCELPWRNDKQRWSPKHIYFRLKTG